MAISKVKLPDSSYQEINAYKTGAIPFGVVDSTSTATAFTATVAGINKLEDGTCVLLKNGVVTSAAGFTININGLGAKPAFNNMTAATRDTTIFNINYTMLLVYDSTRVVDSITGAWCCYRGYNSNDNTIGYQIRTNSYSLPMKSTTYRYRLLFTSDDGNYFVPANNSTSTNATASRAVCQDKIDPFGAIVYYGTTTSLSAGTNPGTTVLWSQYTITLGYSFNRTGAALTLTSWKPVYVKCAPQTDGSVIIDSDIPYVQSLPATNDGKVYIFLGVAYSATAVELLNNHPVYYHDGTGIRLWCGKDAYTKPSTGIPATDLASGVQTSLGKANSAYQKPGAGIPSTDLASDVQTSLEKADTAYQKPNGGIPLTDLASGIIPTVDRTLSTSSTNAVQNSAIAQEFVKVAYVGDILESADEIPDEEQEPYYPEIPITVKEYIDSIVGDIEAILTEIIGH